MANISDTIEQFIKVTLGDNNSIDISRNSLAEYFACVPSQINYVLDTRFTVDRGFLVESKRGGSGFIKITKINNQNDNEYLNSLVLESVGDELNSRRMSQILDRLETSEIVSSKERTLIESALSEESLSMPFTIRDRIRAQAFKNVLIKLMINN